MTTRIRQDKVNTGMCHSSPKTDMLLFNLEEMRRNKAASTDNSELENTVQSKAGTTGIDINQKDSIPIHFKRVKISLIVNLAGAIYGLEFLGLLRK